jgi:dynein heavy chain 1
MASLLGDVLYASSFLSYIGFFDFYYRQFLYGKWIKLISSQNINIRKELNIISYLSSSSDLLLWQSSGLPNDNLCNENAIILKRFKR